MTCKRKITLPSHLNSVAILPNKTKLLLLLEVRGNCSVRYLDHPVDLVNNIQFNQRLVRR